MKLPVSLVLIAAAGLAACAAEPAASEPGAAPADPVAVAIATVAADRWPVLTESGGVVQARASASIASRLLATVVEVPVRAGDRVRAGDVLVRLDAREPEAMAARALAALAASERGLEAAGAEADAAEAALVLARATDERIGRLFDQRSATAQERDEAMAARARAEAGLSASRARLEEARAGLEAARATAEAAATTASYGTIRAPFDGVVASRGVDPGTLAQPGATLLTLEDTSRYQLDATVDASRARGLAVGATAEVRIDDAGDGWLPARVAEIARVDPGTQALLVTFDLPEADGLRSGLFGRVRLSGAPRDVLVAPATAVARRGQLAFVYAVDGGQRARLRAITLGEARGDEVAVTAGLTAGDRVVAAPPAALADGQAVRAAAGGER